ncbi:MULTISPECIES: glutaredoxin family protein [Bacillaceae]|uniref:glutaredoxin family protein n=1 Tax=Bacillaceae TaxID=186817 RepID=UPI002FFF8625
MSKKTILTLYTRNGCHLCEDAMDVLRELEQEFASLVDLQEIDISTSDELTERYGLMIPVVLMDGEEVAYGHVNKFDISNRLQVKKGDNR